MLSEVLGPTILSCIVCVLSLSSLSTGQTNVAETSSAESIEPDVPAIASLTPVLTMRKFVDEVNLVLSVTDKKGRFVQNLRPTDLTILDNGEPQASLTFFESQTELPLRIAILLDVSSSVSSRLDSEKSAIETFVQQVVRPMDSAMVLAFNEKVQLVAPITEDWKRVLHRVNKLKAGGSTALYDAVNSAADFFDTDHRPARRIMILITDGEENSSHATLDATVARVLKSGASINAVNVGYRWLDVGKAGEAILRQLSDATGGTYLQVGESGDLGRAFSKIRRELRSQYLVAYRPSNLAGQTFHHLQVSAPGNLRVRCRTGYYVR